MWAMISMRIITTAEETPIYTLVWDGVLTIIPGMTPGIIRGTTVMAAGMAGAAPGTTAGGTLPGIMVGIAPGTTADGTLLGIMAVGTTPGIMAVIGAVVATITVFMTDITAA